MKHYGSYGSMATANKERGKLGKAKPYSSMATAKSEHKLVHYPKGGANGTPRTKKGNPKGSY